MRVTLAKGSAEASHAHLLLVPVTSVSGTLSPWWGTPSDAWAQPLLAWLERIRFKATALDNELCPRPGHPGHLILFVGLGDVNRLEPGRFVKSLSAGLRRVRHLSVNQLDVLLQPTSPPPIPAQEIVPLTARALHAGTYELDATLSATRSRTYRLLVNRPTDADRKQLRAEGRIGEVLHRIRTLANEPGNTATPARLVAYVKALKKRHRRLKVRIWGPAALRRLKCEALLAVGRGSRQPPCLIELQHPGDGRSRPVVLVGKTITFDSGGLSLKPAKSMEWMRYDKCGGMAVLGALESACSLNLPQPVTALLAVAENMPGGDAMRPGDIVTTRSGQTVEILNTDAEGRLVLADALDVAHTYRPHCIVDLATLTGAASIALGKTYSALFGRPKNLVDQLREAGERTGELLWPMPLHPDYDTMLNSPFADMKNTGDGSAGAVAGAMFLRRFIHLKMPWCHLDLTNAWLESNTAYAPAGATLFGAHLLVDWLRRLEREKQP